MKEGLAMETGTHELLASWRSNILSDQTGNCKPRLGEALKNLSKELDRNYTHSRFNEWLDRRKKLPKNVTLYVAKQMLPELLQKKETLSSDQARRITEIIIDLLGD